MIRSDTRLHELSAAEMARVIECREATSEAIVRDCLMHIEEREPVVHAWAFLDPELAIRQARTRDQSSKSGPLHGIPIGVKDIIETADMPTEMGSPIYEGFQSFSDAACVALVRAAGAVILGKTATAEFAGMTPCATTNPHDAARTPGGSSSGSGAAVADCMVPAAFGTQTGGSVLRPASFCGVFGFKPSFGRYNRAGVKPAAESLDTVGLITRTIDDLRLLDAVLVGMPVPQERHFSVAAPRVGVCRTHLWNTAQPETVTAVEDAAERLARAGASVTRMALPDRFEELTAARVRINDYERARALAYEWHHHRGRISERLQRVLANGFEIPFGEYAMAVRSAMQCRFAISGLFSEVDVLLVPCVPGEAPTGLGYAGDPKFQELWTLLHVPSMTLPTHNGPNGLPVGIQLVAAMGQEQRLLDAATWIWDKLSPPT